MEILTHSRLKVFRSCQRKEKLSYQDGYRATRENEAIRDGELVHKGLEVWWKSGGNWTETLLTVEGIADPFQRARVEELLTGYHFRWALDHAQFTDIKVEQQFEIPLLNPETMAPSTLFRIGGKVDVIARHANRTIVVEHKTTASAIDSDGDSYWERLSMDHQLSIYFLGGEQIAGVPIDECLYDVIRKPALRPLKATPEENRKYKKDGSLYATQRENDETASEYQARLREEIDGNSSKYYQRKLIPRTMSQIQDFMFDAWQTAATLRESMKNGRSPRNPEACIPYGAGSRCVFWNVCSLGMDPAEDSTLRKADTQHEELAMEVA